MNRLFYRLVFNAARGQLMAVAEVVVARRRSTTWGQRHSRSLTPRAVVLGAAIACAALPSNVPAQIVAYRHAPATQQPTILSAGNGIALVNIQTPSPAGVSRNAYSQFDVPPTGAILNNSRSATATQLAGWIAANPWLARGSARVILNEVVAVQPSVLQGYVEVAGAAAQVVIANPAGISCSGCGFINTPRSTLTTGTPRFSANGDLDGYRVEGGTIRIEGAGLDASRVSYTDLIARTVSINAGIWTNELTVATGVNTTDADTTRVRTDAVPSAPPIWSIDVAALGGMYAGKIILVGSEKGVGVRNAGTIAANAGEVVISADGRLHNAGQISSSERMSIESGGVDNSGTLYSHKAMAIGAHGRIDNSGTIAAQGDTSISAHSSTGQASISGSTSALFAAGMGPQGSLAGGAHLSMTADTLIAVHGQTTASGQQSLHAASLDLSDARLHAGTLTLSAANGNFDARRAVLSATGTLEILAAKSLIHDEASSLARRISIAAHDFSNVRGELMQSGGDVTAVSLAGSFDNGRGVLNSNGPIGLLVGVLDNRSGSIAAGNGSVLAITASGSVDNTAGRLVAGADLTMRASGIDNRQGTIASVQAAVRADAGDQRFGNETGRVEASSSIELHGTEFGNAGGIIVTQHLAIDSGAQAFDNTRGTLAASDTIDLRSGTFINDGGLVQAGGALSIDTHGQLLRNADSGEHGGITARGLVRLDSGELINTAGLISTHGEAALTALSVNNLYGQIRAGGKLELDAQRFLDNRQGLLVTDAPLVVRADGIANADGTIVGADIQLDSRRNAFVNTRGTLAASATLAVRSGALNNDGGLIQAGGGLAIDTDGQALNNVNTGSNHGIVAWRTLAISAGSINNGAGFIAAKEQLDISAKTIANDAGGRLGSEQDIALSVDRLDNHDGQIQALGSVAMRVTDHIENRAGLMRAGQNLRITSGGFIDNNGGTISATDRLEIAEPGVVARDAPTLKTLSLNNTRGTLIADQQLSFDGARLGGDGKVLSLGDLSIKLRTGFVNTGELGANGDLSIESTGLLSNQARMQAGKRLSVDAPSLDNSAAGRIIAATLNLKARDDHTLTNRGLIDGGETLLDGVTINNLGSGRIYGDHLALTANVLNNSAEAGVAAVIAARDRLDIGTTTLVNSEHALIFSAGDLAIGGVLDASHNAIGQAERIENTGATIEALGGMALSARQIANRNAQLETTVVELPTQHIVEYQGSGSVTRYASGSADVYVFNDESEQLMTPEGKYESWLLYDYVRSRHETQLVRSEPGRIVSGRGMHLNAGSLTNDNSQIIAGAALSGTVDTLINTETTGERTVSDTGTVTSYWRNHRKGRDDTGSSAAAYTPPPTILSISLGTSVYRENTASTAAGSRPAPPSTELVGRTSAETGRYAFDIPLAPVPGSGSGMGPIVPRIVEITANGRTDLVVRSLAPAMTLPDNSLFRTLTTMPTAPYLVETDPQFTNRRQWLSSDYLLGQLGDPALITHRRLGDGFFEQRLLREQIAQLTGQRFLSGHANDETQYRALMDSAITQAARCQLVPGIELSAGQMAQLTADIVWLVERSITLPDGSSQRVLVPQVYALVRDGDLVASGALISAHDIELTLDDDLLNGATIAGRQIVALSAENIGNIGGRIDAQNMTVAARKNLANTGGVLHAQERMIVSAGNDLTISSTTRSQANAQGERSYIDRLAGLYVSGSRGSLIATAGNDLSLTAARIVNTATDVDASSTVMRAAHNVTFDNLSESSRQHIAWDSQNTRRDAQRTDAGSTLYSTGSVVIQAGNDVDASGAYITSERGALSILAGNDIKLVAGQASNQVDEVHQHSEKGLFSRTTRRTRDTIDETRALASTLSAAATTLGAGGDIAITGSNVIASGDTTLFAGGDITVGAAFVAGQQTHFNEISKSGIFSSGGVGFTIGSQQQSTSQSDTHTSAQASTVGSIDGNVVIASGKAYRQVGSDVVAAHGSIDIAASSIALIDARENWRSVVETKSKQSGLTVALSSPVITAVQSVQQMRDAAVATSDPRMQLLAAASGVLAIKEATDAIGNVKTHEPTAGQHLGGVDIGLSIGSATQQSTTTRTADTTAVSRLIAGTDLRLNAMGAGEASDLTVRGTRLAAGRDISLAAAGRVALLGAPNSTEQHSSSQGRSASVGFSIGTSGLLFNAGASALRANADGSGTTWIETTVDAGQVLTITSGGDTVLRGAQAHAEQIVADVGGKLTIESLQDTSTYASQQSTGGFTLSLGAGSVGGSVSAAHSTISSDYASVVEQSGLMAGDGGFQVKVAGSTELTGGVITSSQIAVDKGANAFTTVGTLALNDISNHAEYQGTAYGASLGKSTSFSGALPPGGFGTGAGYGENNDTASSTTRSGISGIAGNTMVRTGDNSEGIANAFDAEKVQNEINAQVQITQMFGGLAYKVVRDHMHDKRMALRNQLRNATSASEVSSIQDQIGELDLQEHALNVLIGVVTGTGGTALAKETLAAAANRMRQYTIEDSTKFPGVVDVSGYVLSNLLPGKSAGIREDGMGGAGTRIDLDLLCGADNSRCAIQRNPDGTPVLLNGETVLAINEQGFVQFTAKDKNDMPLTLEDFLKTEEGRKMAGPTGGIQGYKGTLFGVPYEPNSWQDKLLEAFSGTHDVIGGTLSGLYDEQGNIRRGLTKEEVNAYNAWSATAIVPSSPFSAAVLLPSEVWSAVYYLLKLVR